MRELSSAAYWAVTGALMTFGFFGLMSIGLPFLLIGWVMAVLGLFMLGIEGTWAITIGIGAIPVYIILTGGLLQLSSEQQITGLALFGVIAFSGPVVRLVLILRARLS